MSDKRFQVVFTGKLVPGTNAATVISNLTLDLGLSDEKARTLLERPGVVLKHFPTSVEAQRLAERFERAGARCIVEDRAARKGESEPAGSGESSLITFISRFKPVSRREQEERESA